MTIASIDIGTNTVLLLVASVDTKAKIISPILNLYRMPRLGKGLIPGENIKTDRIDELFDILSEYNTIITKNKTKKVIVTATNAFRVASNASDIVNRINNQFKWNVNIISGEEEAEFAYLGAISGKINSHQSNMVIDIGGGSTELIQGFSNKIKYRKSFKTGSVSATESYLISNPPENNHLKNLNDFLTTTFKELKKMDAPTQSIAISGTPTTLACMVKGLKTFDDDIIEGISLENGELRELLNHLTKMTPGEIKMTYGSVMNGREDIILAGALILLKIMELVNIAEVKVSSRGIRYGAIMHYLNSKSIYI